MMVKLTTEELDVLKSGRILHPLKRRPWLVRLYKSYRGWRKCGLSPWKSFVSAWSIANTR